MAHDKFKKKVKEGRKMGQLKRGEGTVDRMERIGSPRKRESTLLDRKMEAKSWQQCFSLGMLWTGGISIL